MKNVNRIKHLPYGILVFFLLHLAAVYYYPGGSQENNQSIGYSWLHNYWCDLMKTQAINLKQNHSSPYAIIGLMALCLSMILFFIQFANKMARDKFWQKLIKTTGILSMVFAMLISNRYHNYMIGVTSLFGLVALIGIIKEIYLSSFNGFKLSGIVVLILLGLNNVLYYTSHFTYLPLLQKNTFLVALIWVIALNFKLNKI